MKHFDRLERQLADAMKLHLSLRLPVVVPEAGRLAWGWFAELSETRTWHAAGPNPIAHSEIVAWAKLSGWPICARHVALIRALDDAWAEHFYQVRQQERDSADKKKLPPRSDQSLSPELFDAMFG